MRPNQLIAVQELLRGAWPSIEHVSNVELVARARRQQYRVADSEQHGVTQHFFAKDPGLGGDAGNVSRLRAEEGADQRVDELAIGFRRRQTIVDLRVEAADDVVGQQSLADHGSSFDQRGNDGFDRIGGMQSGYALCHLGHLFGEPV